MKYFILAFLISCSDNKPTQIEQKVYVKQLIRSTIIVDDIPFEKMCTASQCSCTKRVGSNDATNMDCEFFDSILRGELNSES